MAVERQAGEDYIQHKPYIDTGKEGFITFLSAWPPGFPANECRSSVPLPKAMMLFYIATKPAP